VTPRITRSLLLSLGFSKTVTGLFAPLQSRCVRLWTISSPSLLTPCHHEFSRVQRGFSLPLNTLEPYQPHMHSSFCNLGFSWQALSSVAAGACDEYCIDLLLRCLTGSTWARMLAVSPFVRARACSLKLHGFALSTATPVVVVKACAVLHGYVHEGYVYELRHT
jgi:hypothetical protein